MAHNYYLSRAAAARLRKRNEARAKRLHYHSCDFCPSDRVYACSDYHCQKNKKRVCRPCRRAKKYHYGPDPDLFQSVAAAARHHSLSGKHAPADLLAVHMESHWEGDSGVVHTYWACWQDGTKTQMTEAEIAQWTTAQFD